MSAIRNISAYYGKSTCDHCGADIANITRIEWIDGSSKVFGSSCINKILKGDNSVKSIWKKNVKRLAELTEMVRVFNLPPEEMPRGSEYYGSGLYFIGNGSDYSFGTSNFFHPIMDVERNLSQPNYHTDPAEFRAKQLQNIAAKLPKIEIEIKRITGFLSRFV